MKKRIFVDVSNIVGHDLHTGIQRVVKEITKSFVKPENNFEIELMPFRFTPRGTVPIAQDDLNWLASEKVLAERTNEDVAARAQRDVTAGKVARDVFRGLFYRAKVSVANFIRNEHFSHFLLGSARSRGTLNAYLTLGLMQARPVAEDLATGIDPHIRNGDVVLLLDSSWDVQNFKEHLARFKSRGARTVSVMYDVIPLSHSQFVVPGLTTAFRKSLGALVRGADQIITISASELVTVNKYVQEDPAFLERTAPLQFGYFHLGCNLPDDSRGGMGLNHGLPDHFLALKSGEFEHACIFLCVGTVEPRKNIDLVLDGFFQVWLKRRDVILVLVGKPGWKTEKLQQRIAKHPLLDKNIFWSSTLNDSGLMWLYGNSDYLLQASVTEGFGLPIVEAMVAGKPILCSDIPVFHEVAGEKAIYFDPADASSLTKRVNELANLPKTNRNISIDRKAWITWDESAAQLLDQIYPNERHVR